MTKISCWFCAGFIFFIKIQESCPNFAGELMYPWQEVAARQRSDLPTFKQQLKNFNVRLSENQITPPGEGRRERPSLLRATL